MHLFPLHCYDVFKDVYIAQKHHSSQIYFETKFVWMFKLFIMQIIVILARHGFYSRINLFPTVVSCHAAGEGFDKLWDSDRRAAELKLSVIIFLKQAVIFSSWVVLSQSSKNLVRRHLQKVSLISLHFDITSLSYGFKFVVIYLPHTNCRDMINITTSKVVLLSLVSESCERICHTYQLFSSGSSKTFGRFNKYNNKWEPGYLYSSINIPINFVHLGLIRFSMAPHYALAFDKREEALSILYLISHWIIAFIVGPASNWIFTWPRSYRRIVDEPTMFTYPIIIPCFTSLLLPPGQE